METVRNLTLDRSISRRLYGLRGAAILLVLWDHYAATPLPLHLGPVAVRLFFVLTGFHITLSFWKAREEEKSPTGHGSVWQTLKAFYLKRFVRIAPLFYGCLLLGALVKLPEARKSLGWDCLFLTNFHTVHEGDWPVATAHFWSLAVQEQFYLLWPFVLLLACRRWFTATVALSVAGSLFFRWYCDVHAVSPLCKWLLLPGCWDSFMGGAVLAHLYARGVERPLHLGLPGWLRPCLRGGAWIALPFAAALWIEATPALAPWAFLCETLEAVSLAAATWYVFTGLGALGNGVLENRHLVEVGKASYALYVFQAFLYFWVWHKVTKHYSAHLTPFVATCTFIALTALGVAFLARIQEWGLFVERRVLRPLFA